MKHARRFIEEDKKKKSKKPLLIIIIVILVIAAAGAVLYFNWDNWFGNNTTTDSDFLIDPNAGDGSVPTEAPQKAESIRIPGYPSITIAANTPNVTMALLNPEDNPCYFKFEIVLKDTDETIYVLRSTGSIKNQCAFVVCFGFLTLFAFSILAAIGMTVVIRIIVFIVFRQIELDHHFVDVLKDVITFSSAPIPRVILNPTRQNPPRRSTVLLLLLWRLTVRSAAGMYRLLQFTTKEVCCSYKQLLP